MSPCPTPWPGHTPFAAATASSHRTPRHTMGSAHSASERAVQCPSLQQNKRATSEVAPIELRRSVITTIRFRWLPLISFHKLIFIFSIPPHGSGAFPGASVVSSFLSSSLRPLFVRLVNARSWFYFPFAGPPAIPMVGAPGNTPEPAHNNEFR